MLVEKLVEKDIQQILSELVIGNSLKLPLMDRIS